MGVMGVFDGSADVVSVWYEFGVGGIGSMLNCPTFVFMGERLLRCLACWIGCLVCIRGGSMSGETGEKGGGRVPSRGDSGE